jgi:hypothetical protein
VARESPHAELPVWAFAHWLSAGVAIVLVWAADRALSGTVAWPVAGFLATAVYLVLHAAQAALAARG